MAQLVEQLIRNQQVAGSSPASSSKKNGWVYTRPFFLRATNPTLETEVQKIGEKANFLCRGFPLLRETASPG